MSGIKGQKWKGIRPLPRTRISSRIESDNLKYTEDIMSIMNCTKSQAINNIITSQREGNSLTQMLMNRLNCTEKHAEMMIRVTGEEEENEI